MPQCYVICTLPHLRFCWATSSALCLCNCTDTRLITLSACVNAEEGGRYWVLRMISYCGWWNADITPWGLPQHYHPKMCFLPFQLCTMTEKKQAKDITLQMCFMWVTVVGCGTMTAWWRQYRRVMSYAHEYLAFPTYCTIAAATQSEVSLPVTKLDKLCVCVCVCVCVWTFVAEC